SASSPLPLHDALPISFGVTRATTRPSDAARSAFRAAAASPLLRRIFLASSKSPEASTSARLQSIIPTPVSARKSATSFELISMRSEEHTSELQSPDHL